MNSAMEMKANQAEPEEPMLSSGFGRVAAVLFCVWIVFGAVTLPRAVLSPEDVLLCVALAASALAIVTICVVGARQRRGYKAALAAWEEDRTEAIRDLIDRTEDVGAVEVRATRHLHHDPERSADPMNNTTHAMKMKANQTKPDEPTLASGEARAGLIALALVVIFMLLAVFAPDDSPSSLFFAALAAWALLTAIICVVGARKRREYKAALAAWDEARVQQLYAHHDLVEGVQDRAPSLRLEVSWGAKYTPDTPDDEVTWFDEYADPRAEAIAAVDDGVRQGLGSVLLRRERVVFGWSAPHEVTQDAPTPLVDGAQVDVVALELRYLNGTLQVDRDGTGLSSTGEPVPLALLYTDSDGDGWLRLHPADSPAQSRGFDRVHIIVPAPAR